MIINHNMSAMNANRQMSANQSATAKSTEKLSSGLRINRAGDDAAGLSISEKMRSQIRGLDQSTRNAQDGISYIQTAEGALTEVSDMLVRMKELAVQKENETYSDADKANIDLELDSLIDEIENITTNTKFNGKDVFGEDVSIALGADGAETLDIKKATFTELEKLTDSTASTVTAIESAITEVNTQRATYGSQQNRLEHTINNQNVTSENLTASESRIRDVDMAKEMMEFTKNNILSQASQSMLAQAKALPNQVLSLLQ